MNLTKVKVDDIYGSEDTPLPDRMAQCTPDMANAIQTLQKELSLRNSRLVLSDMFRTFDMQYQAWRDYTSGKKKAYSPRPGGSMHEAGRAMDISINHLKPLTLEDFWNIAIPLGFSPIINTPSVNISECWHFDYRGSHQLVYDYYNSISKEKRNMKPYEAMSVSAITDHFDITFIRQIGDLNVLAVQCLIIRLGDESIGLLDGINGPKTNKAITKLLGNNSYNKNINFVRNELYKMVIKKYPKEYML